MINIYILYVILDKLSSSWPLHIVAEGREAVDFYQSNCKEFGLSTLHIRGQSLKVVTLLNAYAIVLFDSNFDQSDGLSKQFGSDRNRNPN